MAAMTEAAIEVCSQAPKVDSRSGSRFMSFLLVRENGFQLTDLLGGEVGLLDQGDEHGGGFAAEDTSEEGPAFLLDGGFAVQAGAEDVASSFAGEQECTFLDQAGEESADGTGGPAFAFGEAGDDFGGGQG